MAHHLDLEEQEQLDQLKHFWKTYGNLITWVLIVVFGGVATWNGYQYWERSQAAKAAALFEEVERAVLAGDASRTERAFQDIRNSHAGSLYAQQAALMVARSQTESGKTDAARESLKWLAEQGKDDAYRSIGRLRLASLHVESKSLDAALAVLNGTFPPAFEGLAADRQGDILKLQGKKAEAVTHYQKALAQLEAQSEYRRLVEVKLAALGVDVRSDVRVGKESRP